MKKKISLAALCFATLMLVVLSFVPHHHHGEEICLVAEQCDLDGTINDIHTAHHSTHKNENGHCPMEDIDAYLYAQARQGRNDSVHDFNFLPLLLAILPDLVSVQGATYYISTWLYAPVDMVYVQWTNLSFGLRAPPVMA